MQEEQKRKLHAYAIALDDDIGAQRIEQVRDGKLWRGWIGTIYGVKVGTTKGALFDSHAEALENARMMREQCRQAIESMAAD